MRASFGEAKSRARRGRKEGARRSRRTPVREAALVWSGHRAVGPVPTEKRSAAKGVKIKLNLIFVDKINDILSK